MEDSFPDDSKVPDDRIHCPVILAELVKGQPFQIAMDLADRLQDVLDADRPITRPRSLPPGSDPSIDVSGHRG
jgi:hypothetical protein